MTRKEAIYELERMKTWSKELSDEEIEAIVIALKALSSSENPNNCGDAISRQAVLDAMYELCGTGETLKENPWRDNPHIDAITDAIENLPSAKEMFTFCPNCGAKMEV